MRPAQPAMRPAAFGARLAKSRSGQPPRANTAQRWRPSHERAAGSVAEGRMEKAAAREQPRPRSTWRASGTRRWPRAAPSPRRRSQRRPPARARSAARTGRLGRVAASLRPSRPPASSRTARPSCAAEAPVHRAPRRFTESRCVTREVVGVGGDGGAGQASHWPQSPR